MSWSFCYESDETCESCLLGKMPKSHLVQKEKEQECCLNLYIWMYMVQWVSMQRMDTLTLSHLLMTILDMVVYLMKHKSESFEKFTEFKSEVEKQSSKSIFIISRPRSRTHGNCLVLLSGSRFFETPPKNPRGTNDI